MKRIARLFSGPVMVIAGLNHFVNPGFYRAIMPDYVPAHEAFVFWSGVAEAAGALGTMHPRTRRAAGWFLIATLVLIFPANVHMAMHPDRYPRIPEAGLYARLPLQALFVYWVWLATQSEPDGDR